MFIIDLSETELKLCLTNHGLCVWKSPHRYTIQIYSNLFNAYLFQPVKRRTQPGNQLFGLRSARSKNAQGVIYLIYFRPEQYLLSFGAGYFCSLGNFRWGQYSPRRRLSDSSRSFSIRSTRKWTEGSLSEKPSCRLRLYARICRTPSSTPVEVIMRRTMTLSL